MKVRMKVAVSGTRNGQDWPAKGEEIDLPDGEAADLCAAGLAEPVAEKGEPEKAVAPEASERRGRGRPRKQDDAKE